MSSAGIDEGLGYPDRTFRTEHLHVKHTQRHISRSRSITLRRQRRAILEGQAGHLLAHPHATAWTSRLHIFESGQLVSFPPKPSTALVQMLSRSQQLPRSTRQEATG